MKRLVYSIRWGLGWSVVGLVLLLTVPMVGASLISLLAGILLAAAILVTAIALLIGPLVAGWMLIPDKLPQSLLSRIGATSQNTKQTQHWWLLANHNSCEFCCVKARSVDITDSDHCGCYGPLENEETVSLIASGYQSYRNVSVTEFCSVNPSVGVVY
jgi:hypothetical protein